MNPIRVLLADDQALFREGLRTLLSTRPELEVIGEAANGFEACRLAGELKPDVLLLDLSMPVADGLAVLRDLARQPPPMTRAVVLTAGMDKDAVMTALQLGARGVLLKESATTTLFECLRCVMADQYWLGREDVKEVVEAKGSRHPRAPEP